MKIGTKSKNFFGSLQFRILVIIWVFCIIPSVILAFAMVNSYEKRAVSVRSIEILSQAKILGNQVVMNNFLEDQSQETIQGEISQLSNIYDGRVMLINSSLKIVVDSYSMDVGKTIISEKVIRSLNGEEISVYDSEIGYIELVVPLTNLESQETLGVLLVSVSTDSIQLNREYLYKSAILVSAGLVLVVLVSSSLVSGQLVKPLKKMASSIRDVDTGHVDRLEINNYTETKTISKEFNRLHTRLKIMDSSREEFVSNVSHELKTPLASMKVLADSLNGSDEVPIELYREFMHDIGNEIDRETKIINDLLSLVRMDRSSTGLNIETVNINELIELILKRLRPIAQKQSIEIVLESFRPVTAEVDEVKITLAITNLVENAIKYNKPEGWIHVSLNADHQYFYIKVEDSGIGIPEDSIDNIFERFYRVDKSHSREIGGTGLGLAITRSVVHLHRGAIKVFSVEGEGTVFDVRIPLTFIPPENSIQV
ncbi:MAG: cell wall metabolism sensor histidine kinase WalK [Lachnospiraceae bacterium]|nr:cell wall metabolism sensor histidine kinase WalK [Lachnospiraceae bacterium]